MQRVSIGVGTALLALILVGKSVGFAATNSAADPSYAAVIAAVNGSQDGDTSPFPGNGDLATPITLTKESQF